MMCGIDDAIKYISQCEPRSKDDIMPERIVNRLTYIRAKDDGAKPKYHKGKHIRDYWTCGNCGRIIHEVVDNYCCGCGYLIKWDSTRCLTGVKEADE